MILKEYIEMRHIAIHKIGSKYSQEESSFSKKLLKIDIEMSNLLTSHFLFHFKTNEYFSFCHEIDLKMNEVYSCAKQIFINPDSLLEESINLAKHLYMQSAHPRIKAGEFYTIYFKDCILDGETVDAIGLFKSENKDTFLKVYPNEDGFEIERENGININKLDKGCLIFNTEQESGFIVSVVDNTNKGTDAQYWLDNFLHVRQRKGDYYNTQNIISLCKKFVKDELPQQFDVTKADQVDLLNKSVKFMKERDKFNLTEFTNEVICQPEIIDSFNQFRTTFLEDSEIEIAENFNISESALKKQARALKSVIKLDKNFHIYIHGDRQLIEQGEDNKGKFYKVYFQNEN